MSQNKILVAVDGSEHSDKVLDTAIEYTKFLRAKVILVYCHKKFPTLLGEPLRNDAIFTILQQRRTAHCPF